MEPGDQGSTFATRSGAARDTVTVVAALDATATPTLGVVGLSESLPDELSHFHIGVSVLCPGPVATDIVKNTANLHPAGDVPSDAVRDALARSHEWLAAGTPPNVVGQIVLDAITAERLHILTDELIADMAAQRSQRILHCRAKRPRRLTRAGDLACRPDRHPPRTLARASPTPSTRPLQAVIERRLAGGSESSSVMLGAARWGRSVAVWCRGARLRCADVS